MRPPSSANPHWRPYILSCPFCLVDFKIIRKLEEMSQDRIQGFQYGLADRVDFVKITLNKYDLS